MPADKQDIVVVGKVGRAHGVKGHLKIHSFTEQTQDILEYQPWFLKRQGKWQKIDVTDLFANKQMITAQFENCTDRDEAKVYTNLEIGVPKTVFPDLPEGEYYWKDLEGLTVINTKGVNFGVVERIMATGANDVLIANDGKKEELIPYLIDSVIIKVDMDKKCITVDWDAL